MPSAEDTSYLFKVKVMPETTQDLLTRDVDILVSQIKENLRLTGFKAKSSVSQRSRPRPYLMYSSAETRRAEKQHTDYCHNRANKKNNEKIEDDPYEKLREFLEQGRLISEAVKKLQAMNCNNISNSNSEIKDEEDDQENDDYEIHHHQHHEYIAHCGYPRKTRFYESEDEP